MAALARALNALALLGVCGVLAVAFYLQLVRGELPCPLCLLQRAALLGAGPGLALNVRFGASESHYGVVIVRALAGAAFAVRQILLHIVPGTGAYGSALLGYHFYTWALVIFVALIEFAVVMLFIEAQFVEGVRDARPSAGAQTLAWLFVLVVLANAVSTLLQCGFGQTTSALYSNTALFRPPPARSGLRIRASPARWTRSSGGRHARGTPRRRGSCIRPPPASPPSASLRCGATMARRSSSGTSRSPRSRPSSTGWSKRSPRRSSRCGAKPALPRC